MTSQRVTDIAVIGGGPAGLRAAQILSGMGWSVALFDQKTSVGRKLLVAGKGGLNLSHSEERAKFVTRYGAEEAGRWERLLDGFSYDDLRRWAEDLGIETFIGSSGRLFPIDKKAAPLLVSWTNRLKEQGVLFHMEHTWKGVSPSPGNTGFALRWVTPQGLRETTARAVVLAMGGASWPETGSDGAWVPIARAAGWECADFAPANCGWEVAWPETVLAEGDGQPVKNITVTVGERVVNGELLITRYGLEGGALYQLGRVLREMAEPTLLIDLKPTFSVEELVAKLEGVRGASLLETAVKAWKLRPGSAALLRLAGSGDGSLEDARRLATSAKGVRIRLTQPRSIAEAISSAGGLRWSNLDEGLMVRAQPGIFCAGEMLDWEAPTGGYLLHGCLAQGTLAAQQVDRWLRRSNAASA